LETSDTGITGQPVVASDAVIVSSSTATYLFNLQTGAIAQTLPYGGPVSVAGGKIFIAGTDGVLRVYQPSAENINLAADGTGAATSYGYNATGQTLNVTINSLPATGTVLNIINNIGSGPIIGTFSNLPAGGTINLVYNGTTYVFTANYAGGDGNDLTLTYTSAPPQAPVITSLPPPAAAAVPFAYHFAYNASGYPAPAYTVVAGALPPGLTLTSAGILSGTPTQPGTYTGTVSASNGVSPSSSQNFTIVVQQAIAPEITNGPAPAGVNVDTAYNFTYMTSGYPAPTFSVSSGNLPPGITLSASGVLSGTPTQVGNYAGTISATNGYGAGAVQNLSIVVQDAPVITSAPIVTPLLVNTAYTFTLTATGNPVPIFSVTAGSLPPGIALSSGGVISGTPTVAGLYAGTISATNATSSVNQSFLINVQASPSVNVYLPGIVNEGDPDGAGVVVLNTPATSNLTVTLNSSNTGALTVPATVVVPAGQTSVALPYVIIDNLAVYGSQTSTVTASAAGWVNGNQVVTVTDNKTTDNWSSFGNGQAHTGYYPGPLLGATYSQAWSTTFPSGTSALNPVAVAKGVVYVTPISRFSTADLTAVSATTGSQLWQYVYSTNGLAYNGTGYNSINPPTVYKGNVYVQQGQGLSSGGSASVSPALWSFNGSTGQVNWSVPFGAQWESYFAPTVYQSIGIWVDAGTYGGLYGFGFNGAQESSTSEAQYDQWTPTYYNGAVYTWVGSPSGNEANGTFTAVNPSTGAVLWTALAPYTWQGWSMNCAAPISNNLAFLNGNSALTAISLTTHATAWSISGAFKGTPAVYNGTVYAIVSGTQVEAINASTGAVVRTFVTPDSGLSGQPVITPDSLIVSSSTNTYMIDLQTGALAQTIPYGGPVSVANGVIFIAGSDGTLRAFRPNTVNMNLAADDSGALTADGYAATGQTLNLTLGFAPAPGQTLTIINNTGSDPISGTFSNLPNGGTVSLTFGGTAYSFVVDYAGGDGNDLTLTYAPSGGGTPTFTTGSQPIAMVINSPFSFT
jgi:hypothetical protein